MRCGVWYVELGVVCCVRLCLYLYLLSQEVFKLSSAGCFSTRPCCAAGHEGRLRERGEEMRGSVKKEGYREVKER